MTTALFLLISGVLIGAGITIIWRDAQRKRRRSDFVSSRDLRSSSEAEAEITIAAAGAQAEITMAAAGAEAPPPAPAQPAAAAAPRAPPPLPPRVPAQRGPSALRLVQPPAVDGGRAQDGAGPTLEQRWLALQPAIAAGVDKVNAVMAPLRLAIGAAGEPSWSYKHRGYGVHRRLLLGGESLAWLRIELDAEGRLHASLKAHKEERAELNAAAEVPADGLNAARAGELLSRCLEPAARHAAQEHGGRAPDEEASEQAWKGVDAMVTDALKATNGALAQAGARLVALAPAAWDAQQRRHRLALSVEVDGEEVARMHIERLAHEIEVAVGVREAHLAGLGRRRRLPVQGMTIHALAETIAGCAWPAIARFRETLRPA